MNASSSDSSCSLFEGWSGLFRAVASASAADKITWNISIYGAPRANTAGIEAVAEYVKKQTGGNFILNLAYGETLSPAKENIDAVKIGVVEGAMFTAGYAPGKTPLVTVLGLPFLPVPTLDATRYVHEAFYDYGPAKKEMAEWNAMQYLSLVLPQYEAMGTGAPPTELEGWKGVRVRALAGMGEAMELLGAVPTTVTAPELYTALERGTVDVATFPFSYAFGSYKLYEVSDWFTSNLRLGTNGSSFIFGIRAWEALPTEYQNLLMEAKKVGYDAYEEAYGSADEKWIPIFEKNLEKITYSEEALAQFREVAGEPVWAGWVAEMEEKGLDGQAALDHVLAAAKEWAANAN